MLSFPSFPFIAFFLQVLWSKFAILIKFFSKKTNEFWTTTSNLFLPQVSISSFFPAGLFPDTSKKAYYLRFYGRKNEVTLIIFFLRLS